MSLFEELKRRNVFKVAVAYIVTAWLLMQVADLVLENIGAPSWVMQTVLLLLAIGFPISVILAWAFEVTPEGIKRERDVDRDESITHVTGRKLNGVIITLLALVAIYFFWESRFQSKDPALTPALQDVVEGTGEIAQSRAPMPAAGDEKSIAVLPFVNLSSDPEQEFFSDGISEELLNVLAQYPDLQVAARTSSFQFKGDNRDISEIAKLLKVNHVLEGSVRKSGTRLRITAQLIEADNGYHLWSETYDRELDDVFAIQDEISAAIGAALRSQLKLDEETGTKGPRVEEARNTAAYESFLHGRHLINQRGNRAITEAVQHLQKSLRLDPNYAPAHAQLAIAYMLLSNSPSSYGDLTDAEVKERATPHITRAEELNPELPELWGAKAQMAGFMGRDAQALAYTARALELNPVYIDALNWRYNIATSLGEYAIADEAINRLIDVDPYSIVGGLNYLISQLSFTDPQRAHEMAAEIAERNAWAGYAGHDVVAANQGKLSKSLYWSLLAYREDPIDRYSNDYLAQDFAFMGLLDEALRVSEASQPSAYWAAGEYRNAAELLERDIERDPENFGLRMRAGSMQYLASNYDLALSHFDRAIADTSNPIYIDGSNSLVHSIRHAFLLQRAERTSEATRVLSLVRQASDRKIGTSFAKSTIYTYNEAMLRLLEGDTEAALVFLERTVDNKDFLHEYREPIFEPLFSEPRFQALIAQRNELVTTETELSIALICLENPIPDAWQPLEKTCASFESAGL